MQCGPLRWTALELISVNCFFSLLHKIDSFLLNGISTKFLLFVLVYSKWAFSVFAHRSLSLWSACSPDEIRLDRSTPFCMNCTLCDIIPSDSKLAARRKNLQLILHPSKGRQKGNFSKRFSTLITFFTAIIFWISATRGAQNHTP